MAEHNYQVRQLADELQPPESGKQNVVLTDDENARIVLFAFAAGAVLAEHVAPLPAIIQIIQGEADLTVGEQAVEEKPGTWIEMAPKTPHSIKASTPLVMLLTLLKTQRNTWLTFGTISWVIANPTRLSEPEGSM